MTVTTLRQVSGSSICASTRVRVKEGTSEAGPAATTTPRPDAKPQKCDLVSLLQLFAAHTCSQRLVTKDIPPPKGTVLNAVRASQETPRRGERERGRARNALAVLRGRGAWRPRGAALLRAPAGHLALGLHTIPRKRHKRKHSAGWGKIYNFILTVGFSFYPFNKYK